jgi:predicted metalloprotease
MKWKGRRQSDNVEDRGMSSGGKTLAGGGIVGFIILLINVLEVKMSKC